MKMQACASGYEGPAATVYGFLDPDTDLLVIAKIAKEARRTRFGDCAIVSNMTVESWDAWFDDTALEQAIAAFERRRAEKRVQFGDGAEQANPATVLQVLKVDESGRKYEIAATITNRQVAALMLAWYADKGREIAEAFDFGDRLKRFMGGEAISV